MPLVSKRGFLGVKWIYWVGGVAAYFFRKQIKAFAMPWIEKLKAGSTLPVTSGQSGTGTTK